MSLLSSMRRSRSPRRRGAKDDVTTGDSSVSRASGPTNPISLYGRNSASGTYGFFKEHSLNNGDYKDSVKEQPGSASVVQGATVDRFAMGYSGIGYATAGVRAVPLTEKDGGKCVEATADNAYSGSYPLARFLYVYATSGQQPWIRGPISRGCALAARVRGRHQGRYSPSASSPGK